MPEITVGPNRIAYEVVYSRRRRTVGIQVLPGPRVVVRAPPGVSAGRIEEIVREKAAWVLRHLAKPPPQRNAPTRAFVTGERFPFLGRDLTLKVEVDGLKRGAHVEAAGDDLLARVGQLLPPEGQPMAVRLGLLRWYYEQAAHVFDQRLALYCPLLGVEPIRVTVKDQSSRWGSCSVRGAVHLNWRVVMAPLPVVDYLIVHELSHLTVHNHSPRFWKVVGSVLPDHARSRAWLRANGPFLSSMM